MTFFILDLWDNLISLQSSAASSGTEEHKEAFIMKTAEGILEKLPNTWDVVVMRKEKDVDLSPTEVVLFQELERFNKLIEKIGSSLKNLKRALKGEIGMSADLGK